jgi:putative SOS response-associated peptidase YedK
MALVRASRTDGQRHFALARWGFVPSWVKEIQPGKPLINARAETVAEKPSFRNAFRRRRCLIPADGFYEWEGDVPGKKKPWFIHREDHGLLAFAGLWEHWVGADGSELETSVIITTEANAQVGAFHPRSPVVIAPEHFERWLDYGNEDGKQVMDLLKPVPDDFWVAEPTVIQRNAPLPKPKAQDQMKLF